MADRHSFWTSVSGMLTGLAAIIAAIGGIYLGLIREDKDRREALPSAPSRPAIASNFVAHSEWPSIAADTFSDASSGWSVGSNPSEKARLDLRIMEGKYRWDVLIHKPTSRFIESPYGSAVDFYVAVDARLIASTATEPHIALLFGRASNKDYGFTLLKSANGAVYSLSRFDGRIENVIPAVYTPTKLEDLNRLAVLAEDGMIKLFLNSTLVGSYRDPSFTGGTVALDVGGNSPGSVVVDFDNFEFRRRPR